MSGLTIYQPKLSEMSLELSKMLSDQVESYITDGKRMKALQRVACINDGREKIYNKLFLEIKNPSIFVDLFPEYKGVASLNPASLPDTVKNVISIAFNNNIYFPISSGLLHESLYDIYSPYYKTKGKFFVQAGNSIIFTDGLSHADTVSMVYLKQFEKVVLNNQTGAVDIPERQLFSDILEQAFKQATLILNYS
jgi:hypothetical protein